MPVFNSTAHFKTACPPGERLKAEDVLTQRMTADPSYNHEIPAGSLVAVHSTVSLYTNTRGPKNTKMVSFNLIAIQILAMPNESAA